KDELAEDLVFSMLIGDGDRHFGNYRVTTDQRLVPFDYGLADIVRSHPYRQSSLAAEIRPAFEAATRELDELLGLANPTMAERTRIRKLSNDLEVYQRRALYQDILEPVTPPGPDGQGMEAFVRTTTDRHLDWATRAWRDAPEFLGTVAYEDFEPHLRRLRDALERPGVLDRIVDQAMEGHPDIEYTRRLLRTRLEAMGSALERRFPKRSPRRSPSRRSPTRVPGRIRRGTRGPVRIRPGQRRGPAIPVPA
ncbi:MAG: hypothetical protein KDA28_07170, partial [Phycisphaerales bacterium]|nr:hypothetical protein [Phycisphaerales bacterium]